MGASQETIVYVHYGNNHFDPILFHPVKNCIWKPKPEDETGLWASRVDDPDGWKEWCTRSKFCECVEENSFRFKLKSEAKVLLLESPAQLEGLPKVESFPDWFVALRELSSWTMLDYEELAHAGYDAVEMRNWWLFRESMPCWDCNSVCIMNPDIIEEVPL